MKMFKLSITSSFEAKTKEEAKKLFWEWLDEIYGDEATNIIKVVEEEELEATIKCNKCEWKGQEEDLEKYVVDHDLEAIDACPNCKTDEYLMDLN